MSEECLICRAEPEYLESDILMECELCYKKGNSKIINASRTNVRSSR